MKTLLTLLVAFAAVGCVSPIETFPDPQVSDKAVKPAEYSTAPVVVSAEDSPKVKTLEPIKVWVSPDVTYQDEVKEAVSAWAVVTKGIREWALVDASEDKAFEPGTADLVILQIDPLGGTCNSDPDHSDVTTNFGCVWDMGGLWNHQAKDEPLRIFLVNPNYQANPELIVMHEIGHLLGLTHQDGGIMQAKLPLSFLAQDWECPDPVSVDRLSQKLNLEGLTSCALP